MTTKARTPAVSWASSEGTRRSMQSNKGRDTKPELALRSALHRRGHRFRVNIRPIAGFRRTADIAFTRKKLAIFVDGCFWHGCSEHGSLPRSNREFWTTKLKTNMARDIDTCECLEAVGWTCLRLWEHHSVDHMVQQVESVLRDLEVEGW
jgi:DNA mismatch endonuclease (patch repair protein)